MSNSTTDIQTLSIEKVMGTITEEDNRLLESIIEQDASARDVYDRVVREMNSQENIKASEQWDSDAVIAKLVKEKGRRKPVRLYAAIATAASLLIFAGIYFLSERNRSINIAKVSNDIVFTTGNGKAVTIDSNFQQAVVGNVTITATGGVLHYSVAGDSKGQVSSLQVPAGKDYTVELSDHSRVHLNSATTISFPVNFSDLPNTKREITIDGEAFLDVAHDAARPFIVHLPKGDVQVLGTMFNVNSYLPDNTEVSLVSGSVRMSSGKDGVLLKPGEQAFVTAGKIGTRPFDATRVLAWQDGKYLFQDAALSEVGQVLKRYYGLAFEADGLNVNDYLYTGTLHKNEPVAQFLFELSEALNVRARVDGGKILLTK